MERRLPPGRKKTIPSLGRLFPQSARTWILAIVGACLVAFVFIPIGISRLSGANAVAVSASALMEEAAPTPVPLGAAVPHAAAGMPQPSAEPTPTVRVSQYTLLQQNDDYPSVQHLQTRLMELGYLDSDEPSTVYNEATTVAVSLFQRTLCYEMNGVADCELQEYLFSAEARPYEIKLGDSGSDVESVQSRLDELGYYDSKINGYFGVATEEALQAFEAKNKLPVDGVFHVPDRDLLFSPEARPRIDPTPTPKPTQKPTPKPTKKPATTSSSGSSGGSPTATPKPASDSSGDSGETGGSYNASYSADGLVSVAKAMLGVKYTWSEEKPSKGFDCSGLVYFCLRTCGISISRYSAAGFSGVSSWQNVSSIGDLQKGDLLFFRDDSSSRVSHTGIYIGGGQFIHASSSKGKVVQSSISTSYWTRNFVNGRRVF